MNHQEFGVHIALTKYPLGEVNEYIKNIGELYSNYKTNIAKYLGYKKDNEGVKSYLEPLYNPNVFHLFSHFDAAFISIIDSYKFTQRVFEPRGGLKNQLFSKNVSYQIISGSLIEGKSPTEVNDFLSKPKRYLNIVQLKITNGLVIGNGDDIFKSSIKRISEILEKYKIEDHVLVDSFNWSELVLIASHEQSDIITQALLEIRRIKLKELHNFEEVSENSLYKKWGVENILESHVFNDTHSYIGVDYNSLNSGVFNGDDDFETQIEWQIKPGHFPFFLQEAKSFLSGEDFDVARFTYGKTDFVVSEATPGKFKSNQDAFRQIRTNELLRNHVRKIKTKSSFKFGEQLMKAYSQDLSEGFSGPCSTENELERYLVDAEKKTAKYLRALNISRNIRKKVRKIIYNFNQGIQDPVLYIYYIDLYTLLNKFIDIIEVKHEVFETAITSGKVDRVSLAGDESSLDWQTHLKTKRVEDMINSYVEVFEEALQDRLLNNYNFEDLNEFSLDINSANTSILSSYDAIVKICATCFRDSYDTGIVTRINDIETISNSISVNYNIDNINCPPLVFATLLKEILNIDKKNFDQKNDILFDKLYEKWKTLISSDESELSEEEIRLMSYQRLDYFEIDFKKFYLTYFKRDDLFLFWHWGYALQNTSSYSSVGNFDEVNFIRELFRVMLISEALGFEGEHALENMKCPIPELKSFWDRHFKRLCRVVKILANLEEFKLWVQSLEEQVYQILYEINFPKPDEAKGIKIKKGMLNLKYKSIRDVILEWFYEEDTYGIKQPVDLPLEEFINNYESYLQDQKGESSNLDKIQKISILSYFCLDFIYNKFESKVKLLRRNYATGKPIPHFLIESSWYIDPMGGFFINCHEERKEFNHFNNCVLHLVWSLGVYLKKDQLFVQNES